MPDSKLLLADLMFPESPRWHDDRLWLADWAAQQIIAVDLSGISEVVDHVASFPFSIDWLPDGRLLVISAADRRLLCQGAGGGRWPASNGMAVTPDNATLIVGESYASRLTAFDIAADGTLSNRRTWAEVPGDHPDGIRLDAEGAVWYTDVANRHCVRVSEGGNVLQTIEFDRVCFACILGGPDRRTLFSITNQWDGPSAMHAAKGAGQVLAVQAPAPAAGWP